MIIDLRPEFGLELTLGIPYAYWLHQRGELEKVITCKEMKPFYFFCDKNYQIPNRLLIEQFLVFFLVSFLFL